MHELSTNSLKLWSKAHHELIHVVKITVPGRSSSALTLRAGQTERRSHLVTLAPDVSELGEEILNGAVTLVADAESLEEGIAQCLAGREVETPQVIPDRLGCRERIDLHANDNITGLTENCDRVRIIGAPLRPVGTLGRSSRADSGGGLRMSDSRRRRSSISAIYVTP